MDLIAFYEKYRFEIIITIGFLIFLLLIYLNMKNKDDSCPPVNGSVCKGPNRACCSQWTGRTVNDAYIKCDDGLYNLNSGLKDGCTVICTDRADNYIPDEKTHTCVAP